MTKKYALVEVTETNEIPLSSYSRVKKRGGKTIEEISSIIAKLIIKEL